VHAVTGTAASKGWNLPGLKCAQLLLSNDRDAAVWAERGSTFEHGTSTPGVRATTAAYRDGGRWLDDVVGYLDGSRALLAGLFAEHLPKSVIVRPRAPTWPGSTAVICSPGETSPPARLNSSSPRRGSC
jgi:cysteine-S-conjugate beta-lyase